MTPVEFRRHLHQNPELSFQEVETASFIKEQLHKCGIPFKEIAKTGVLAWIEGTDADSQCIILRSDIDALPIQEATSLAFKSRKDGVMHACGHDMHAAILFGTLKSLQENPDFKGTVYGLFQPGEECNPGGASLVIEDDFFKSLKPRAVIGLHTDTMLEVGQIGFCEGPFMASNDEIRIYIKGQGGHAAQKGTYINPMFTAARIIEKIETLSKNDSVVSLGRIECMGATNVIASEAYMEGTIRSFSMEEKENLENQLSSFIEDTDRKKGTQTRLEISKGYPAVVNNLDLVKKAKSLCTGKFDTIDLKPRYTSEDFGYYTTLYPSLFVRLGVGTASGKSHTSLFNPDEKAIDCGIEFFNLIVKNL